MPPAGFNPKRLNPKNGLRLYLLLEAGWRTFIWAFAGTLTLAVIFRFRLWPRYPGMDLLLSKPSYYAWLYANVAVGWVVLYNIIYVVFLVFQRVLIKRPKEGVYTLEPGKIPNWNIISSCFLAVLTKARYQPPFPGFLVFNISNLPPFVWLWGRYFGPQSQSCFFMDPIFLDPHLIEIGRNVTIGFGTFIAGHSQERDTIIIKKTIIEDDVLFGGNVMVSGGCRIKRGSVVASGVLVLPFTVIGENELWGGLPARKIKDLPPYEKRARSEALMEEFMRSAEGR